MTTLLKWPGGKRRELAHLLPLLPDRGGRFVDPFVGGGSALFAAPHGRAAVNDASEDLVAVYRAVAAGDPAVLGRVDALAATWEAISATVDGRAAAIAAAASAVPGDGPLPPDLAALVGALPALLPAPIDALRPGVARWAETSLGSKLGRMAAVSERRGESLPERDLVANVEGALKAAVYSAVRDAYNAERAAGAEGPARTAWFAFLREFSYAAMFRFNRAGAFNVPYGGVTYNRRDWRARVASWRSGPLPARLRATVISTGDFAPFLAGLDLTPRDAVFLDPPYDSDFSTYDQRRFGAEDHVRLAATMAELPCPFVLVIKATPAVEEIYSDPRWSRRRVEETYQWTIKDRNDRRATHLVISGGGTGPA